jgi:hypothetical protein
VLDAEAGVLGETSRQWQDKLSGNPAYGLGTFLRRTALGRTFWHSGRVALEQRGGGYSVKFDNGWTTVVTFNGDVRAGADLHRRLEAAVSKR